MAIEPIDYVIQRVVPLVYDDSLSLYELVDKVVEKINEMIEGAFPSSDVQAYVNTLLTQWKNDGTLAGIVGGMTDQERAELTQNTTDIATNKTDITAIKNITKSFTHVPSTTGEDVSLSVAANESVYIPNDDNIFGYKVDGTHLNIGTVQQNDILQYGDPNVDNLWVESGGYMSLRSANNPSFQKIEPTTGNPVESGRTLYHVGNKCNHFMQSVSTGTQLMTKNQYNYINIADVNGQFPVGSLVGNDYTIPRSGLYLFDFTIRPSALTLVNSVCRVGHTKNRTGTPSYYNMRDIPMTSAQQTGFYGTTYMKEFTQGDVITPFVYPLSEDITIQAGTKISVYFLGDKPTA